MTNYRRTRIDGATYFFTVAVHDLVQEKVKDVGARRRLIRQTLSTRQAANVDYRRLLEMLSVTRFHDPALRIDEVVLSLGIRLLTNVDYRPAV